MADKRPEIGVIVGKFMADGVLVVHPSKQWAKPLTEEEAEPYLRKDWAPIRDPFDVEVAKGMGSRAWAEGTNQQAVQAVRDHGGITR